MDTCDKKNIWCLKAACLGLCGVLLCALPALPLAAETDSLGEIKVKDSSSNSLTSGRRSTYDSVIHSTVIHAQDFENQHTDLAEVLSSNAGVHIKRYGGLNDFATASLRGSTSEQVQIYLDNTLLNPASGGGINLAQIPLDTIESIEVYRGNAPARFGTSAIGGVIYIKTKQAQTKPITQATTAYGSFKSIEASILRSQKIKKFSYLASHTYSHSDGDFTYLNDNGTRFNAADDSTQKRVNNDFNKHFTTTKLGYDFLENLSLQWTNHFFREDRGIPGLGNLLSGTSNLSTTRNVTEFNMDWQPAMRLPVHFQLNPFFTYQKSQFADVNDDIGLSTQDNDDDTLSYGSELITQVLWGQHQNWTLLLRYQGDQFKPENFLASPTTGQSSARNQVALSLEDELYFLEERLVLNPSMRFEAIVNQLSASDPSIVTIATANSANHYPVSGKIGAKYQILTPLSLKGSFGRYFRVPSFFELFGDRGTTVGNATLVPEKSYNVDFGLAYEKPKWRTELVYFFNHVTNLIQFQQTSQLTNRANNTSKAQIHGAELTGDILPWSFLRLTSNYTFQWAKDKGSNISSRNKTLPGRPLHEWNLKGVATYQWAEFFANYNLIAKNFLDSQNILEATLRSLLNIGVSVNPWKPLTANFEIKNILNDHIVDVVGFPLPGRAYFGKLIFKI